MRLTVSVAVVVSLALLSGCSAPQGQPKRSPSSTAHPLFVSEDDALAAAIESYGAYQLAEEAIFKQGGLHPERIEAFAVRDALTDALDGFERFRKDRLRLTGASSFAISKIQHFAADDSQLTDVVGVYLCLDVSRVDVVDEAGVSQVESDRSDRQSFEVSFDASAKDTSVLLVSSRTAWSAGGLCD